jgi:gliding motility-associated-like protein
MKTVKTVWPSIRRACLLLMCIALQQTAFSQLRADFNATPTSGCAPVYVSFKDLSTGNPTYWKWDLGNGTISFLQHPSTTYFNPGKYAIKLVIRQGNQSDSVVKLSYITVNALPKPLFSASDTTGCYPLKVNFKDLSQAQEGSITKWEWDLGDGTVSSQQNPVHTYTAPGNYNVILRVTNTAGCVTTLSKPQYIKINDGVKAAFAFVNSNLCKPPSIVNFTNNSTGTGTLAYQWTFGDGNNSVQANPSNTYNTAGLYTVQLIVKNNIGCVDTLVKKDAIVVGVAKSSFTAPDTICEKTEYIFSNASQPIANNATWDFGDGTNSSLIHPTKKYASAGIYNVQLITDFGSCKDTIVKPVTVLARPIISFNADKVASCQSPMTIQFTNTTPTGSAFQWLFGDGNTSTQQNPIHTYQQTGDYNVTLIVTNANGCSDTLTKPAFIKVHPVVVAIRNLPATGCAPLTFTPAITVQTVVPIASYLWNFGDGSTSTQATPSHLYSSPGVYTITFTYTTADGCSETLTYPSAVRVGQKPTANFSAMPTEACASVPIQFTDNSTGNITNWLWHFGDGSADSAHNPRHYYNDTGYFSIRLIVSNNGCSDTLLRTHYVHIKPPVAKFQVNGSCSDPYRFSFTNYSVGATSWTWNFGDGTTSTTRDPVHVYSTKGNYTVTLTVSNSECSHTAAYPARIIIEKADFIASSTSVCKGDSILLQPTGFNAANVTNYEWLYYTATDTNRQVKIAYDKAGKYTVRLIITNINGCQDTMTKPDYITVDGPTAAFNPLSNAACINKGGAIQFTDQSTTDGTHAIKKWQWNFGDSSIQDYTAPPFQHIYSKEGNYTIHLKITDEKGCSDIISKSNEVYISNPKAVFSSIDTMSCQNRPVTFTNESTGPALTYNWNFGDGNVSGDLSPVHGYATVGVYNVSLKIEDKFGCRDSVYKQTFIHIDEPKARFIVSDSVGTCPPLIVNFTNQSKYYQQLNWDFGDGTGTQSDNPVHYYNYPGTYYAKLTVTSPGGCTDVVMKKIVVKGPTGTFSYDKTNACNPGTVAFNAQTENTKSFIWDFNDGYTINTTDSSVSHSYSSLGVYVPRMILEDAQGCKVPILGKDTIRIYGVESLFNTDKNLVCDQGVIAFSDSTISNDLITDYEWHFGDGTISNERNPSHTYSVTGIYPIKLFITTLNGCKDTSSQLTNIKVAGSPQVTIRGESGACVPATLNFFGDILVADTAALKWQWNFGNSITAGIQNPAAIVYQQAGAFNVTMSATNSSGCVTTKTKPVDIHPIPAVDAGINAVICENKTATLQAAGADKYTWGPAATLSCTGCAAPVASPLTDQVYHLQGESIFGCKATDSVIIRVKHPFNMLVGKGDTLCQGESFQLLAANAELYDWTPSLGLDDNHKKSPLARPQQTTNYRVIGYDSVGCFYDTGYVKLTVYPFPTIDLGPDKTIAVGSQVQLNATVSKDAIRLQWQPAVGLSCATCPNPVASPKQTTNYKVLAINEGGCVSKDEMTVFVVCNNGNIFVPNTFSPNGDGANDVFYPRGTGLYNIKSMRIFNRWGEAVYEAVNFQANDASKGWNGDHKGKAVPNDVYVYFVEVLCENNTLLTYSGNIAVIR